MINFVLLMQMKILDARSRPRSLDFPRSVADLSRLSPHKTSRDDFTQNPGSWWVSALVLFASTFHSPRKLPETEPGELF
jgi:hypothetical protein